MKLLLKTIGATVGIAAISGFAVTMVIVNGHDEKTVPAPNTENKNPEGWNAHPMRLAAGDAKIANWNIANFHGTNFNKNHAIAQIINDANVSLIGIEEVDYVSGLHKVARELDKINRLHNVWKVVSSELSYKAKGDSSVTTMSGRSAREYYGFLYDSRKFTPKKNTDGVVGTLYDNPFKQNQYLINGKTKDSTITNTKSAYVRPPFGVTFEFKENKKDFTAVIAHLDSPGPGGAHADKGAVKNHSSKTGPTFEFHSSKSSLLAENYDSKIGSQEAWEAENLVDVMKFFDGKNGADSDLIFMGDTNIKDHTKNKMRPFQAMLDDNFIESFDPSKQSSKTSLGRSDNYANPYDRIFSRTKLTSAKDGQRYDFNRVYSLAGVSAKNLKVYSSPITLGDSSKISDHTMVTQVLHFKNDENGRSNGVATEQKAKEIDVNKMSYFEMTTLLGLSPQIAYKVIYYRSLVGVIDTEDKLSALIKHYSSYKNSYVGSAHFTESDYNVKFNYKSPRNTNTKAEISDQSSFMTHTSEITMKKININAGTYVELKDAMSKGLIDNRAFSKILTLRNAKTPITSVDQLGLGSSPSKELFIGIYDFSKATQVISNPFDVNKASFAEMKKAMVDDRHLGLKEYVPAAIVAYRQTEKIDNFAELEKIVGHFSANKIKDFVSFLSPVKTLRATEADLASKISVYSATEQQLEKYFGSSIGGTIYQNIKELALAEAEKQHLLQGKKSVTLQLDKAIITKSIYAKSVSYFWTQFLEIFTIPTSGTVEVQVPAPSKALIPGQYSFGNLKVEAQKVDTNPTYHSGNFDKKDAELSTFVKYLLDNGAKHKDKSGHVIGTATMTLVKRLIAMINKVSNKAELVASKNKIYKSKTHNNYIIEIDSILNSLVD